MAGMFRLNGRTYFAEIKLERFICELPKPFGTLIGNRFDWQVTSIGGAISLTFPVQDTLFRILFQPMNEPARKELGRKFIVTLRNEEGQALSDGLEPNSASKIENPSLPPGEFG